MIKKERCRLSNCINSISYQEMLVLSILICISIFNGCIGASHSNTTILPIELPNAINIIDSLLIEMNEHPENSRAHLAGLVASIGNEQGSYLQHELSDLVQTSSLVASSEFRCNIEFLRSRIENELTHIRNELVRELNQLHLLPPIPLMAEHPLEPFISNVVPYALDFNLASDRRTSLSIYGFDLSSKPITVQYVGYSDIKDVTYALGVISDYHLVLDLTQSGTDPSNQYQRIVLSWDGEPHCTIPILNSVPFRTETIRTEIIDPDTITIIPTLVRGDEDFHGHGPLIILELTTYIDCAGLSLRASYSIKGYESANGVMLEPTGDFTSVSEEGKIMLYEVSDPGDRITGFNCDPLFRCQYFDTDHQENTLTFSDQSLVSEVIITGDTDGSEAGSLTRIKMILNNVELSISHYEQ